MLDKTWKPLGTKKNILKKPDFFGKCRIVPKILKGGTYRIFNIHFVAKYQKT